MESQILIIDDNADVLETYRKILPGASETGCEELDDLEKTVLGTDLPTRPVARPNFRVDLVQDGETGCDRARQASREGRPYAVAFVDMRMPGGWDGLKTIEALWRADPRINVVICTAYSDYSWEEIVQRLGCSDQLFILRKPFEKIEVVQLACALEDKWRLHRVRQAQMQELNGTIDERTRALHRETHERQRAEQELNQFFHLTPDIVCLIDSDICFKRLNPAVQNALGYTPESLVARPFAEIVHAEDKDRVVADLKGLALQRERRLRLEMRCRTRTGDYRWIDWNFAVGAHAAILYATGRDISENQRLRLALEEREAGLRRAQLLTKAGHVITGPDGSFESWSETLEHIIAVKPSEMPPSTRAWLDIVHPDDRTMFREFCIDAARNHTRADVEYRARRHDGNWIDLREVMEPLDSRAEAQGRTRWFCTIQDITEQKQTANRIQRLNRVHAVLSGINALIVRVREREELFREACRIAVEQGLFHMAWIGAVNQDPRRFELAALCGGEPGFIETLQQRDWINPDDSGNRAAIGQVILARQPMFSNDIRADARIRYPDDHAERGTRSLAVLPLIVADAVVAVMCLHSTENGFFDDEEQKLLLELAKDISFALDHIGKIEKLDFLAYNDALTGLPNRNLLRDRLDQAVVRARRNHHTVGTLVLDLDNFKLINDSLGHAAGDDVLKTIAVRLRSCVRESDTIARIGGDEFVLVLPDQSGSASDALSPPIADMLQRILTAVSQPILVAGRDVVVTGSIGVSVFPNDGQDTEALLKNADAAMYRAKETGRNQYQFFTADMQERIQQRLELEADLRRALEREEFELHYQPQVDAESGHVFGVEALIRWRHPQRGLLAPASFIPVAEHSGLIIPISEWVLRQACRQAKAWEAQGLHTLKVSVNVSGLHFRKSGLVEAVTRALETSGLDPRCLVIEPTETIMMDNHETTLESLRALKQLGVDVAIDDFGTGYSSLAYLKEFPIDALKIDRAFVCDLASNENAKAITTAIIAMANSLDLEVIAEGVETRAQEKTLRELGCARMQGYLYSKPVAAEGIPALVRNLESSFALRSVDKSLCPGESDDTHGNSLFGKKGEII
jgi:diguanylate cyclase (GGDEF)-like protein/PAS domain S-box-containing protein